jgi:uncharacterized protein (TIGR02246 family)
MRLRLSMLAMLLVASPALGATDADRAAVFAVEAAADAALERNDPIALAPLLTEDATRTSPRGEMVDKRAWLALIRDGGIRYTSLKRSDARVRFYGHMTAVVTGVVDIAYSAPGREGSRDLNRYTRIYVKQGGRWLLASHHASRITPTSTSAPRLILPHP